MPAPGAAHYGDSEETQSDCSSAAPISHFGFRSISFRIGHITLQRHLRLSGDRPIVCSRQEPLTLAADLQLGQLSPFLEIERRAVPAPGPNRYRLEAGAAGTPLISFSFSCSTTTQVSLVIVASTFRSLSAADG